MNTYKILIVDDEPLARSSIRQLLRREPDVEIVGEAADGHSAARLIAELRPQIVFLDVQMPELSGVELLAGISAADRPAIIFTTAYNNYAIEAFNLRAVDYLMKPYKDERFFQALERARVRLQNHDLSELTREIEHTLAALPSSSAEPATQKFVVKVNGEFTFLAPADVHWIDGYGDYLKVHCRSGAALLIRDTFKNLHERLQSARFVRVHKSAMVNTEYLRRLRPACSGDYELELDDGTALRVSRLFKASLREFLS